MKLDVTLKEDLKQAFLISIFVIASIGIPSLIKYVDERIERRDDYKVEKVGCYDYARTGN